MDLQSDTDIETGSDKDLDVFWNSVFQLKKYSSLEKLVKACLSIFTGSCVEQSFSMMNNIIKQRTSSMSTSTYEAILNTKYHLLAHQTTSIKLYSRPDATYSPVDLSLAWHFQTAYSREDSLSKIDSPEIDLTLFYYVSSAFCQMETRTSIPPLCVVKGKRAKAVQSFATHDAPKGTVWTQEANAWMFNDIGVQWFTKVFIKNCGEARPMLLIIESHHSHEVLEMLELAEKEHIHILALPSHTTLQPLEKFLWSLRKVFQTWTLWKAWMWTREGAGQLELLHNLTMDITGDDHQNTQQTTNNGGDFQLKPSLVPSSSMPPKADWNAALSTFFDV
ncbi:hypothetical protein RRG08_019397 [Elysia crispata]|uniref:DDE-1 domain-containing protein n=1 Tax=Elysia crispata TaxID=231223 RepID=A0AAE1DLF6_9GAST|nr:hypothetical protein RRG08_019397 [Elysia crispata]